MKFDDAELLAMEMSGEVLPPPARFEQIQHDLAAIRQAYPEMSSVHRRPRWIPGELLCEFTDTAMAELKADEYRGLNKIIAEYGPVEIAPMELRSMPDKNLVVLRFKKRLNPEYLAPQTTVNIIPPLSAG